MGAQRLVRLVDGIADQALAVAFVRHELVRMEHVDAARIVTEIAAMAATRDRASMRVMLLVSIALAAPECVQTKSAIADAFRAQDPELVAWFEDGGSRTANENPAVPDFGRGRPLSLGERKSLARRRDRGLLARVLRDPHPDVIRVLLQNPALTEPDVVRLCARRPIPAEVLREVFRSPRWMVRSGVRVAIAKNPYAPLDLALSIVPHLALADARDIAASPELHVSLRDACARAVGPRTLH